MYQKMGSQQPYLVKLHRAMLITGYFGLLRISEITDGPHVIKAKDVHVSVNKDKLMFILHSSKTHDKGSKPQIIKISAQGECRNYGFCPFQLVKEFIAVRSKRAKRSEAFFIFQEGSAVKPEQLKWTLKKLLKFNGFDHRLYTVHGIRSGRATELFAMGFSVETIRQIGRWKSSAIYAYLRS